MGCTKGDSRYSDGGGFAWMFCASAIHGCLRQMPKCWIPIRQTVQSMFPIHLKGLRPRTCSSHVISYRMHTHTHCVYIYAHLFFRYGKCIYVHINGAGNVISFHPQTKAVLMKFGLCWWLSLYIPPYAYRYVYMHIVAYVQTHMM